MSGVNYVTKEALENMKAELQRMKTVDRPAASRAIAEAREKGDLRENAEYDAAGGRLHFGHFTHCFTQQSPADR